ncbi:Enoyl-CoA hydratase/isomerase [Dillenia turbinata]|uniref:Delta(3)-Delta(2)-enoyl-CoA isomerase n=1 Tax=Dillenia turbinata TaxID=194707 RepID=A0AAN8UBY1_9MAGN
MCTLEKRGDLFILTITGDDEQHRLSPSLVDSIRSALAEAQSKITPGSALITTATGKFFSNGFDLAFAQASGSKSGFIDRMLYQVDYFKPLVADLISFPAPTIAAVNGHAAAAGLALALSHDYIIMRSDRGVLYMSEVDLGMTLPDYFTTLFRAKIGSASVRREILLAGRKVKGAEAVKMGIVEAAHDSEEKVVESGVRMGAEFSKRKWNGEVFGEIRKSLYPELCGVLGLVCKMAVASKL